MSRRKNRNASGASESSRLAAAARAVTMTLMVVVFGALAVAALFGTERLEARVAASLASESPRIVIAWPTVPADTTGRTWMPADFQTHLTEVAYAELGPADDPLGAAPLERIGTALERTGWFIGRPIVRREPGGQISVDGRWRIPAAVVRHGSLDYLVSSEGELLPGIYGVGTSNYRVIHGVKPEPPRRGGEIAFGEPWPGTEVRAAVRLLTLASGRPWWNQVRAIDAAEYAKRRRLVIVTDRDARIVWGAAPGEAVPGEQSDDVKLQRLDLLAQRHGRVDAGKATIEVFGPITLVDDSASGNTP